MLSWVMTFHSERSRSHIPALPERVQPHLPRTSLYRHRDEKPVTATPLESAFTNCDARNPFRFRIYENTGVSVGSLNSPTLKPSDRSMCFYLSPFFSHSSTLFCAQQKVNSFVFMQFRTLSEKHPGGGRGSSAIFEKTSI